MKLHSLFLFALLTISYAHAQNLNAENKKDEKGTKNRILNQGSLRNPATLDEGYNELEGGIFAVKEYLVRGKVSMIRLSYGPLSSNLTYNNTANKQKYYLQKAENEYREIFMANQNPSTVNVLLKGGVSTRHNSTNRKLTRSFHTSSKTTLIDLMGDKVQILTMIKKLKKIKQGNIKKLVKAYNQ